MDPFFPTALFAYLFALLLIVGLGLATWWDLQLYLVPKKITLGLVFGGLCLNSVRGGWLGSLGHETWTFGQSGSLVGAVDGFSFALCGALAGFSLFFVLWILGTAGGGDVKLAAGVGAWVGPFYLLIVVGLAIPVVLILTIGRGIMVMLVGRLPRFGKPPEKKTQWRLLSFSLPMTIAVVLLGILGFWGRMPIMANP